MFVAQLMKPLRRQPRHLAMGVRNSREFQRWEFKGIQPEREFIDYKTSMITGEDPLRGLLFS